jgi:hypothetical protein
VLIFYYLHLRSTPTRSPRVTPPGGARGDRATRRQGPPPQDLPCRCCRWPPPRRWRRPRCQRWSGGPWFSWWRAVPWGRRRPGLGTPSRRTRVDVMVAAARRRRRRHGVGGGELGAVLRGDFGAGCVAQICCGWSGGLLMRRLGGVRGPGRWPWSAVAHVLEGSAAVVAGGRQGEWEGRIWCSSARFSWFLVWCCGCSGDALLAFVGARRFSDHRGPW